MRIAGMREDDDGTCLYLVEGEGPSGERLLLLYDENGGKARPAEPAGAEALFREGLLERCSFPAEEVFFPDELEDLERKLLSAMKKEEDEEQ
ncbi:hypothetical protein SDC9_89099 [bioreactor metagenome]|jgi:hypothetical protein|uniref:DUF1292 domain-containing protein n=1 Tax=bioreactor metagenome TaxID=1076179 RepID=A0A644ZXX9_9ZZZZ|nr:hypothetical protein [Aminivibrio sp.]MDD3516659.1 hypothetical protein [Synergistaceae bacterium]MEA4952926.1 hypothetical protein [Aminivibrio sp.]HPF85936.1 hypothetical protein [Aminivibrio sp.]HPK06391.1 hypothetical protein [Aminivibrio sp.]HRX27571.1 hypothetical protein [Aminivibrio sp.]